MKNRFLGWIYRNNKSYFDSKLILEDVFTENKSYFELLFIKDFVGHIPKEVNEPALKIFEEYAEVIERWVMWQSWYINRKAMNDVIKIPFYNGMMVYLKVLYSIARLNKKPLKKVEPKPQEVETPWIDIALQGLSDFKNGIKKDDNKEDNSR